MKLLSHYYAQHDADLTDEVPAESFGGWKQRSLDVPKHESALVVMHRLESGLG